MSSAEENSIEPKSLLLAIFAGVTAFGIACAVFWSFDEPWTLRGDNKAVMFPMSVDAFRSWMSGIVPEWTDKIWGGFPLLADPTTMALYWPNYIGFLATEDPHLRAFDFATAVHSGILVSGVVYLLRLLQVRPFAALLGGALIFIAPMHVWYASSMITGYAPVTWWPWMLVAAELISRRGMAAGPMTLGWLSIASCALVYPEFALYGGTVAVAWILVHGAKSIANRLAAAVLLPLGGMALAAPQLLPALLFFPETTRGDVDELRRWDLTQIYFSADTFLYPGGEEFVPSFLGVATLVIALAGVFSRSRRTLFLALLALISFVLSLGFDTPLYDALRSLPGFGLFRQAMKLKMLTELAVVMLFAFGVDHLMRRGVDRSSRRFAALMIAMALVEHFTYVSLRVPSVDNLPGKDDESFTTLYNRMIDSQIVRFARNGPQPPIGRISGRTRLRSIPAIVGVPTLQGGPNALIPEHHKEVMHAFAMPPGPNAAEMDYMAVHYDLGYDPGETRAATNPCLNYAVQRGLLMTGRHAGTCMFYNRSRPSRFIIAPSVRRATDVDSMVQRLVHELTGGKMTRTDPVEENTCEAEAIVMTRAHVETSDVILSPEIPVVAPIAEIRKRSRPFGRAGVVDYRPGAVDLLTVTNRPGFLIAKESYFKGWEARVAGEVVPIYRAAGLFFAVPVPSGQHEVTLRYSVPGFREGVRIALGWVVFACVLELLRRVIGAGRARKAES